MSNCQLTYNTRWLIKSVTSIRLCKIIIFTKHKHYAARTILNVRTYNNIRDVKRRTSFLYLFIFNFFKYDKQIIVIYQSIIARLAKIMDYRVIILITKISNNAKNIYFNYDYVFSIKQNYELFFSVYSAQLKYHFPLFFFKSFSHMKIPSTIGV